MTLQSLILSLMARDGLATHQAMADELGVSKALVGAWLRGRAVPGPLSRFALIDRFDLDEVEASVLRRLCDEAARDRVDAVA